MNRLWMRLIFMIATFATTHASAAKIEALENIFLYFKTLPPKHRDLAMHHLPASAESKAFREALDPSSAGPNLFRLAHFVDGSLDHGRILTVQPVAQGNSLSLYVAVFTTNGTAGLLARREALEKLGLQHLMEQGHRVKRQWMQTDVFTISATDHSEKEIHRIISEAVEIVRATPEW